VIFLFVRIQLSGLAGPSAQWAAVPQGQRPSLEALAELDQLTTESSADAILVRIGLLIAVAGQHLCQPIACDFLTVFLLFLLIQFEFGIERKHDGLSLSVFRQLRMLILRLVLIIG
jgi:hypothetical protein